MSELTATTQFIVTIEILGLVGLPLALRLFHRFPDVGWGMSKVIGIVLSAWLVWILSSLHIVPFNRTNALILIGVIAILSWLILSPFGDLHQLIKALPFIIVEETLFIGIALVWTYVRGFSPDINGLEKFMDYGFMLSSMKTTYFPPLDHFLSRETINYYYFGHYIAGFVSTIASVPSKFGYNLMMSSILGLGAIQSFSLATAFFFHTVRNELSRFPWRSMLAGILAFLFVNVFGNLHTAIYYPLDYKTYWYPDATRFIENTIHEFPIYSYIVNDLHGHVSDIPIVLLALGIITSLVLSKRSKPKPEASFLTNLMTYKLPHLTVLGFIVGTMYATNAWDFAIYLLLSGSVIWTINALVSECSGVVARFFSPAVLIRTTLQSLFLLLVAILFYLPFWLSLVPISDGIGIVPLGGQSPLWQIAILWGVQVPLVLLFVSWIYKHVTQKPSLYRHGIVRLMEKALDARFIRTQSTISQKTNTTVLKDDISIGGYTIHTIDVLVIVMTAVSFLLIILPELIYIKDIYPTHYRANTMFKFYYQAWIMLGIVAGVGVVRMWNAYNLQGKFSGIGYKIISALLIFAAMMYPVNAIEQGFGGFKQPRTSIDGTAYLTRRMQGDGAAIKWINDNIKGQPIIIEAVGDSYTDYARVAANTANPTVLGWPVHEWLWRGSYGESLKPTTAVEKETGKVDTVAQRVEDVRLFYETSDPFIANGILRKYHVSYIYVGQLERDKYENLDETKFADMNVKLLYDKFNVQIYQVSK